MPRARRRIDRAGASLRFIGATRESSEPAGCILWGGERNVEFNAHTNDRAGCNLGARGKCVCYGGT